MSIYISEDQTSPPDPTDPTTPMAPYHQTVGKFVIWNWNNANSCNASYKPNIWLTEYHPKNRSIPDT